MGKRKKSTRKLQGPKKKEKLATSFQCLFCNHENSVTVKMDKKAAVGQLSCKVCGQNFQMAINYLSVPIDVYSEWIDACDAVAKTGGEEQSAHGAYRGTAAASRDDAIGGGDTGYSGEGIVDDDVDGEADYDDE